jgi:hypothetical protein
MLLGCLSMANAVLHKDVIYASKWGCALNSDINAGGGTDDSACLQSAMNALISSGGGTLVIDGFALISNANVAGAQTTALQTASNLTIDASAGGLFLADHSNCPMLGNMVTGNPNATFETGIKVIGGVWNGNSANQDKYENADPTREWVYGFWFGGFNGLTLENVTIRNAKTFSLVLSNGKNFVVRNAISTWDDALATNTHQGYNRDGIHMFGTLSNGQIYNYSSNGDDDVLAFNTDEGVDDHANKPSRWMINRMPWSGGEISNIYVDGINFNGSSNGVRWIGYSIPGGIAAVDNITLRNIGGTIVQTPMQNSGITSAGPITIDGWHVKGPYNSIDVPASTNLMLRNILPGVVVATGTRSRSHLQYPNIVGSGTLSNRSWRRELAIWIHAHWWHGNSASTRAGRENS